MQFDEDGVRSVVLFCLMLVAIAISVWLYN
jgi:hypothetical protein